MKSWPKLASNGFKSINGSSIASTERVRPRTDAARSNQLRFSVSSERMVVKLEYLLQSSRLKKLQKVKNEVEKGNETRWNLGFHGGFIISQVKDVTFV